MDIFNMTEYNTKWVTVESGRHSFEFYHYRSLDGDRVIIYFSEKNIYRSNVTSHSTTRESNKLVYDLLSSGWIITKTEYV